MSARRVTVRELMTRLALYRPDLPVVVIYPGHADPSREYEGNLAGIEEFEVVQAVERHSGWTWPIPARLSDVETETILVLSDVGLQWLNDGVDPSIASNTEDRRADAASNGTPPQRKPDGK